MWIPRFQLIQSYLTGDVAGVCVRVLGDARAHLEGTAGDSYQALWREIKCGLWWSNKSVVCDNHMMNGVSE